MKICVFRKERRAPEMINTKTFKLIFKSLLNVTISLKPIAYVEVKCLMNNTAQQLRWGKWF